LCEQYFSKKEELELFYLIKKLKNDNDFKKYFPSFIYFLSGGAAKGFTHFAILKSLEMSDIFPEILVGTSSGAIVGALYSYYLDAETSFLHLLKFINSKNYINFSKKYFLLSNNSKFSKIFSTIKKGFLFTKALIKSYSIDFDEVYNLYSELFSNINYNNLKIKFYSSATDFIKGKTALFDSGNLPLNILASCAIPGLFPQIKIDNSYYVDGFVAGDIPIPYVKKRLNLNDNDYYIIASDLSSPLIVKDFDKIDSFFDIILRTLDIAIQNKTYIDRSYADFIFNPIHEDYNWDEFNNYYDFLKVGFESFKKSIYFFYKSIIINIENKIKNSKNVFEKFNLLRKIKKYYI